MNLYQVTIDGRVTYVMQACSLQAASQFVRHWSGVMVRRIQRVGS